MSSSAPRLNAQIGNENTSRRRSSRKDVSAEDSLKTAWDLVILKKTYDEGGGDTVQVANW